MWAARGVCCTPSPRFFCYFPFQFRQTKGKYHKNKCVKTMQSWLAPILEKRTATVDTAGSIATLLMTLNTSLVGCIFHIYALILWSQNQHTRSSFPTTSHTFIFTATSWRIKTSKSNHSLLSGCWFVNVYSEGAQARSGNFLADVCSVCLCINRCVSQWFVWWMEMKQSLCNWPRNSHSGPAEGASISNEQPPAPCTYNHTHTHRASALMRSHRRTGINSDPADPAQHSSASSMLPQTERRLVSLEVENSKRQRQSEVVILPLCSAPHLARLWTKPKC